MSIQANLDEWGSEPSKDTKQSSKLPAQLQEEVEKFKDARLREIPSEERYPIHWGQLRSYNQSPKTLGELDPGTHRPYARDDRADPNWEDHFVEVVILDD